MSELRLPAQPTAAAVSTPPNYLVAGPPEHSVHVYLLGLAADERRPSDAAADQAADSGDETVGRRDKNLWTQRALREFITQPIIAAEFCGPKFAVETTRRWLRAGKKVRVVAESRRFSEGMRLDSGSTRYVPLLTALPSGWVHALMLHPRATLPGSGDGRGFYLVEPPEDPRQTPDARRLMHFAASLDAALPFPVLPSWAPWLWDQGIGDRLITPLPIAIRLAGYQISGDQSAWERILSFGVSSRTLRADAPTAQEVARGTAEHAG